MKISLICTVYNEGGSIEELLESIVGQKRTPDEAVFVDAGSEDGTRQIIENYSEDYEWIKLFVEEGCNIAEGRNTAIEKAENDYIVGTDGGCILDEGWVKAMEEAFEDGHEALSGLFKPLSDDLFEFVQGEIRCAHYERENVPDNWPPSSRSVGFTRQAWEDAGKYPEDLFTGEDAKYNSNIRRAGYEWHVVRDAFVYWRMRPSWRSYFKQFYLYGEGDARAGNMFDYPGKIFGVSKVFLQTSTTYIGLIGLAGAITEPLLLSLTVAGFGAHYGYYLSNLKSAVEKKGLKTAPYFIGLVPVQTLGHFLGYHKEKVRKWLRL
ncbi:MAG: glycosyltransferase [Nanohaloarchaea archaeon]|nr:glycosyltransferase [Candidatus Nanohaloarchaea archaeon]